MPPWATILLELAKATPSIIHVVSDAMRGGDTPEEAIAKARALAPEPLDTSEEDAERRARILAGSVSR